MKNTKLIIVDDARMLAEMLSAALTRDPGLQVAGLAHSAKEALALAGAVRPHLILLDIQMPGTNGLDLIAPLRKKVPAAKIIMLSAYLDPYIVHRVLQCGAEGYVEKLCPLRVLRDAVCSVLAGQPFFSSGFTAVKEHYLNSADAFHKILSEREQQLLQLMASGLSDDEIARSRSITLNTVATNRKRIRAKLGLHCDRELLTYARRWGLDG